MKVVAIKWRTLRKLSVIFAVVVMCTIIFFAQGEKNISTVSSEPFYSGDLNSKYISFAINVDWGGEYIPAMLEIFDSADIRCTFFLTGRWADQNNVLAANIAQAGHEIGNHGYSHNSPNAMNKEENKAEIGRAAEAIKNATGEDCHLYAPPSGERKNQVLAAAQELGYYVVLWSADTIDWQKPEPEVITERVLNKACGGAIVLMHPTANTVKALPTIISELREKGYEIVPVSENISPGEGH